MKLSMRLGEAVNHMTYKQQVWAGVGGLIGVIVVSSAALIIAGAMLGVASTKRKLK